LPVPAGQWYLVYETNQGARVGFKDDNLHWAYHLHLSHHRRTPSRNGM
jgi:hypothetical protein